VASTLILWSHAKDVGKDLTPAKVQMRLPGLVWGGIAMEAALGRKRLVSLRYIQLGKIRAAAPSALVRQVIDSWDDVPGYE